MKVTGGLVAFAYERSAYSITLEDMGDQVRWRIKSDELTVATGAVLLDDFHYHASLELRLDLAFQTAFAYARDKRRELFAEDAKAAIEAATAEE